MITNPQQPHQNPKLGVSALFTAKGKSGNSRTLAQKLETKAQNRNHMLINSQNSQFFNP
jgi:hypothetical protein